MPTLRRNILPPMALKIRAGNPEQAVETHRAVEIWF
jgi:hypothetical protein